MKSRRPAFTLLELLAAMSLTAVIALTLAACLHTAFDTREKASKSLEAHRAVELAMETIRNDMLSAVPPSRGTFAQSFTGVTNPQGDGNDDLLFYATAPVSLHMVNGLAVGNGDIKQVEITAYLPANSTDMVLVRRTRNNLLSPTLEDADEEVLCRHVVAISFQYYDQSTQSWLPTWDSTTSTPVNTLPFSVQVTLSLNAPDKNADGTQKVETYTRVFQLPCIGASNNPAAAATVAPTGAGGGT